MEERLIGFAALIIDICESLPKSSAGLVLSSQLTKSVTSAALNYGEARGAESKKDFIHKMGIVLKELRETFVGVKIIRISNIYKDKVKLEIAFTEKNELIAIFVASLKTAKKSDKLKLTQSLNGGR